MKYSRSTITQLTKGYKQILIKCAINSGNGIAVINGGNEINIKENAKLNANMDFVVSDGNVTATKKAGITPSGTTKNGLIPIVDKNFGTAGIAFLFRL